MGLPGSSSYAAGWRDIDYVTEPELRAHFSRGRRTGELRGGPHREAGLGGDHQSYSGEAWGAQGASQAVDREPRPRVPQEKGALQRLIRLAESNPEWVLGYEDETWWSRFEQPSLHSWAEAGKPMRLLRKEANKDDPDPKALVLRALCTGAGT